MKNHFFVILARSAKIFKINLKINESKPANTISLFPLVLPQERKIFIDHIELLLRYI